MNAHYDAIEEAVSPRDGTASPVRSRTTTYAWFVATMLSLAFLLSILDRYLLSVVIDDIRQNLALTDTQLGVLLGPSFVILFVIASLPFGWLADVANRKWTIIGGMLCWSFATAWCGLAETFAELFSARLLVGFGEAALLPSALSLITAYFSRDKLSRGIAIFSMGASFGRVTAFAGGGLLFAWFAARGGLTLTGIPHIAAWQTVFLTAGMIGLIFSVLFAITIREPRRLASSIAKPTVKEGLSLFWVQRWAYLAIFIPYGMTAAMGAGLAGWSVAFYTRIHGLDVATASSIVGVTGIIFGPAGHIFGGWVNDYLRSRGIIGGQPLVLAASLCSAAVTAAVFALSTSVALAAVAYGMTYGLLCASGPTGFGGIQLPTPERQRGVISSLFLLAYNGLGNGVGPLIVGVIADEFYPESAMLGHAIAASLLVMLAVGLPFAILGRAAYTRAVRAQEEMSAFKCEPDPLDVS